MVGLVHDREGVEHARRLIHHPARRRQVADREFTAAIRIPQSQQREIVIVEQMARMNPEIEAYCWEGPGVEVSFGVGELVVWGGSFAAVEVFVED